MAIASINVVSKVDRGNGQTIVADVAFDNSYTANGETVTANDLGFRVGSELSNVNASPTGGRVFEYEPDGALKNKGKIRVFANAAGAGPMTEESGGADLSTITAWVTAQGR